MTDPAKPVSTATHQSDVRAQLAWVAGVVFSAFGWLVCTLATGAVAAFVSLVAGIRPSWLILLLAIPLAVVLKFCGCLQTRLAAPIAAAAILLAGFYAACLTAITRVAAATGFTFGEAFQAGGVGLTVQAAKLGLDAVAILVYVAAAIIAALLAAWLAHRPAEN